MEIKLMKKGGVILSDNGKKAAFVRDKKAAEEAIKTEGLSILFGPVEMEGVISKQGEYEKNDVAVIILDTDTENNGMGDIFKVLIDRFNIILIDKRIGEISKDNWDLLGNVNVVVVTDSAEISEAMKFIKKVTPEIVIYSGSAEIAEIEKKTGMKHTEAEKKLKFSDSDIAKEDSVSQLFILTQ